MVRIYSLFLLFFLAVSLHVMGQAVKAERIHLQFSELTNLYRIDSTLYRSDQPYRNDFIALEKYGIQEVLNLRAFHSDDRAAMGTSMHLHHVPLHAYWLSEKKLLDILRILRDRKGPMLIHCYHGSDRTGIVIALYRIVFQDVSKEDAIAEMLEPAFGHHRIFFNITRFLEELDVERMRKELGIMISD